MDVEQSLKAQAEANKEVYLAERRQLFLDQERMSSFTDDAFECESPHAILASSREVQPQHRRDLQTIEDAAPLSILGADHVDRLRVESVSDSDAHDEMAYGELAQPRPDIILRRKRFAVLVVITAAVMSAIAAWLREGFVVERKVPVIDAETKTDLVNSYIGLMMGFIESIIALGIEEIFPVFIVYLHNLRWYPSDDPATKKQSKVKKFALTVFIPAVMMAVGSSLSAVQANQKDDNSVTSSSNRTLTTRILIQQATVERAGLGDTILKTALERKVEPMQPVRMSQCSSKQSELFAEDTLLTIASKAVFGFASKEWSIEFGNGWSREEAKRCEISHAGAEGADDEAQLCEVMPLEMAHDLWTQGKPYILRSVHAPVSDNFHLSPSSTSDFFDDVVNSLRGSEFPLTQDATIHASFETRALSSFMNLQVMTLEVPLDSTTNASVVCGEASCSLLEPQINFKLNPLRKQVGMASGNATNAVFVYGFTIVNSFDFEATVLKRSLKLSFGRLSWQFAKEKNANNECVYDFSSKDGCQVLLHRLGTSDRHLVLTRQWLPTLMQYGSRNFSVSLVQLLEPKVRLHHTQSIAPFATLEHLESWPQINPYSCSAKIDTYLQYINNNRFYFSGDIVETMAASALLYIFQNARVEDKTYDVEAVTVQRRLVDTTTRRVRIFLTNTKLGNVCTWTGCGVLLLLTALVLVLPNERARLAPPRGGNARAERFVAVQTEQIYPNLIYKKRFLIGKTGEEIKFGEFAVESVGLHHKMEEDEQIYI